MLRTLLLVALAVVAAPSLAEAEAPEPAPVPAAEAAPPPKPVAGWNKGFFIQSPDGRFKLMPRGRVQVRFSVDSAAGEERTTDAGFEFNRLRLGFKGHMFTKQLTYRLEMDFGKGGFSPKWIFLDYAVVPGWFRVRAGHFKRPFSRAQLTGDEKQALVDRSITDKGFGAGYDIGVMVHNGSKQPLEWAVSLTNGGAKTALGGDVVVDLETGEGEITGGRFSNGVDLFQPTVGLRGGYNHGPVKGHEELDLEGEGLRFAAAASALLSFDIAGEDDGWFSVQADAIVKVRGFSATGAVYLTTAQEGSGWGSQAPEAVGFHLQAAYLVQGTVAPALRYARIQSLAGDGEVSQEISAGVHVLFWKRHFTWSTDFAALGGSSLAPADTDFRLRSQAQVHF